MKTSILLTVVMLLALFGGAILAYDAQQTPAKPFVNPELCQPLDPPTGPTISVATVSELQDAVNNATSGNTILIADGGYN